eukprot:TRINITY_DN10321_c0_g1_i1.p1 TRINITY_DN10321_c0_g1~~TRINITY_DN10321_c0_g1_i1.p1  ORF type:complete len:139 (+),score=9.96 TRINITY_DN10321_c0_g1_i1:18-434(+)
MDTNDATGSYYTSADLIQPEDILDALSEDLREDDKIPDEFLENDRIRSICFRLKDPKKWTKNTEGANPNLFSSNLVVPSESSYRDSKKPWKENASGVVFLVREAKNWPNPLFRMQVTRITKYLDKKTHKNRMGINYEN